MTPARQAFGQIRGVRSARRGFRQVLQAEDQDAHSTGPWSACHRPVACRYVFQRVTPPTHEHVSDVKRYPEEGESEATGQPLVDAEGPGLVVDQVLARPGTH